MLDCVPLGTSGSEYCHSDDPIGGDLRRTREVQGPRAEHRYALLIGCTKYDNLDAKYQLEGPSNDVPLMESLLTSRYHFDKKDIRKLVETGGDGRPTYANIRARSSRWQRRQGEATVSSSTSAATGGRNPTRSRLSPTTPSPTVRTRSSCRPTFRRPGTPRPRSS